MLTADQTTVSWSTGWCANKQPIDWVCRTAFWGYETRRSYSLRVYDIVGKLQQEIPSLPHTHTHTHTWHRHSRVTSQPAV